MSVRAYKVTYKGKRSSEFAEECTFNCWGEHLVFKRLISDTGAQLNDGCCGRCDVPVEAIVKLVKDKKVKIDPRTKKAIEKRYKRIWNR